MSRLPVYEEKLPVHEEWPPLAMPLSEELCRPISCSCRGGLAESLLPPPWLAGSCSAALAWLTLPGGLEAGSGQTVSRLPTLQSDWLVSEVSEEPETLWLSPPADG